MQESETIQALFSRLQQTVATTEQLYTLLTQRNSDTLSEDVAGMYQARQADIDYIVEHRQAIESAAATTQDKWTKSFARLQQLDAAALEKLNELRTTTQKKLLSVSKRRVLLKYSS